jgi:hypothetical protein
MLDFKLIGRDKDSRVTVYSGNISRFEQGLREPPLLVLLAYARIARIAIDVLVDDDLELSERLSAVNNLSVGSVIK